MFLLYVNKKGIDQPVLPCSLSSILIICYLKIMIAIHARSKFSRFCLVYVAEYKLITSLEDRFCFHDKVTSPFYNDTYYINQNNSIALSQLVTVDNLCKQFEPSELTKCRF